MSHTGFRNSWSVERGVVIGQSNGIDFPLCHRIQLNEVPQALSREHINIHRAEMAGVTVKINGQLSHLLSY